MKKILCSIPLLILIGIITMPVYAQSSDRVWKEEGVWVMSFIETKPGHFNDYVNDLSNVWRKFLEAQKEDGMVESYKMLNVSFARDNEADLILLVEYKDWAAFDNGADYFDEVASKIMGSTQKAQEANINREELRNLRGSIVAQEIVFKE